MIKNFEPRLYQQTIFATAAGKNTLVVLPTGMGKTNIFLMLAAQRLKQYPNSKVLFIGPTKPLIEQYMNVFKEHFEINENDMSIFTGMVSPEKRAELWKMSKIVFSTPQGLENDIISSRINLEEVCLLGVDEAHRAVGDYAYVFVAKQFMKLSRFPRIIALTASPGSDMDKIQEVCKNLFIEDIEVRTDEDPDVKPYVQEMQIDWVNVELPRVFADIQRLLLLFLRERFEKLKKWGILRRTELKYVTKSDLLQLQAELRSRIASGEKDFVVWNAISLLAESMKIYHALELLETQGITALHKYFERLIAESRISKTKAIKSIMSDANFKSAMIKANILHEEKVEHPKLIELQNIVENEADKNENIKIMIFNQYRDNALDLVGKLNTIPNVKANLFVGQQKKNEMGLSQKEQKQMLEDFTNGLFNVLVATSIGEEGLDIPKVDLVIFYEPIPSAIRSIQRRGRTGRQEKGRVIILMAKGTRDEGYRWVAHHKEKKMYRNLANIRKKLNLST
ncbi:DEAD/DEAH box helicase [Candidatus Woesearchaeota archaeon]|nr:DEAD/DEAH box helicase [Candidatus Woesearchaeota archaeon]